MSRQKGGFGGYRGRRTLTDILRLIAVVLTVLVILVLAGLFFGQKYIVQTDRGLQFQLPQALRPGKRSRYWRHQRGDPTLGQSGGGA